jgi:hypothetical protein
MKKAKFLQDAKLDPARFYRNPSDILRDRRLTDEDRKQIIAAWERTAQSRESHGATGAVQEQLEKLRQLREQLEGNFTIRENAQLSGDEATQPVPGL